MPRRRALSRLALALVAVLAAAAGGCSGTAQITDDIKEGHLFNRPVLTTPNWAKPQDTKMAHLGPQGPVTPEDLVDAGGQCVAKQVPVAPVAPVAAPQPVAEQTAEKPPAVSPAAARANARVGSIAGDLASAPMPQGPPPTPQPPRKLKRLASAHPSDMMDRLQPEGMPGTPGAGGAPLLGGIALGMTECQAVRRAGHPSNVAIGAGHKGERKVVLTYLSGPRPGIYTFESGRLKVVDAAPDQLKPVQPKRRSKKKLSSRAHTVTKKEDVYVR